MPDKSVASDAKQNTGSDAGKTREKLDYIDGLRGVGAIVVYLCHFVYAFYYAAYSLDPSAVNTASGAELVIGRTPLNLLYSGNSAVCLFLVISGFVLCLSYFRTGDRERLKNGAKKRYFRLAPMVLISNLIIFILMCAGAYRNAEAAVLTHSEGWFGNFNQFAPSFLKMLFESLIGCFITGSNDYNGVLWTMPYLFLGALVVYAAAYLFGGKSLRYIAYAAMLLASVVTDVYFAPVFLGFALCDIYCTRGKWMVFWRSRPALPLTAFILGVYLMSYPSYGADMSGTIYAVLPTSYTTYYHIGGAAIMLAGIFGLQGLQRFFAAKPFRFLGRISYSLYLLHFMVIAVFSSSLFTALYGRIEYGAAAGIVFICTTVIVLALSALSARYLEPLCERLAGRIAGGGRG